MTILAPTPDSTEHTEQLLTPYDVLDIQCAIQNAADRETAELSAADRQALALLTYDRTVCRALPALLIERILDGAWPLPLDERNAKLLLRLINRLPKVSDADVDAWLKEREPEPQPSTLDLVLETLATYAVDYEMDAGGHHAKTMLLAGLIAASGDVTPAEAIDLAVCGHDSRVTIAGQARSLMVERIRRAKLTEIDDEQAAAVTA